jgi:hypothetical protein
MTRVLFTKTVLMSLIKINCFVKFTRTGWQTEQFRGSEIDSDTVFDVTSIYRDKFS